MTFLVNILFFSKKIIFKNPKHLPISYVERIYLKSGSRFSLFVKKQDIKIFF